MNGHGHFAAAVIDIRGASCAATRENYFELASARSGIDPLSCTELSSAAHCQQALRLILYIMRCVLFGLLSCFGLGCATAEQVQVNDYNREMLQPLTKFRQQHRRTVNGRLCAAAFVQNRKAYTGCTNSANPLGESGRMWCYVEPQVSVVRVMFYLFVF